MNINLVNRGTERHLLVEGKLDTNTAPEAETIFLEVASRFDKVTLNMKDLEYVSSAGLRVIKKLNSACARKGGELVLTNVNKLVMEVFEMTGFAGILRIR